VHTKKVSVVILMVYDKIDFTSECPYGIATCASLLQDLTSREQTSVFMICSPNMKVLMCQETYVDAGIRGYK